MWRGRHLYAQFRRGPHGDLVVLGVGMASVAWLALLVGLLVPRAWAAAIALALAIGLAELTLVLLILDRLRGQVNDQAAALAVNETLAREGYDHLSEFFMDGSAASPSLQLLSLKILLLCRPQSVLEVGSGQSTKVLAEYARTRPDVRVVTLEQDAEWARRLAPRLSAANHQCWHAPLTRRTFTCAGTGEAIRTAWYDVDAQITKGGWEYILVDGPNDHVRGDRFTPHPRSGFLEHVPGIFASRFVLLFDDVHYYKYLMTITAFRAMLEAQKVPHVAFTVHGAKDHAVVCSPEWSFLQSI